MSVERWFLLHGELVQYLVYIGVLVALTLVEVTVPARKQSISRKKRWRTNFILTAINVVAMGALPISFITAAHWAESSSTGLLHLYSLPVALLVGLNLLGRGFISWVTHLLMHKVPLFWRVHRVHHADMDLDVSTTVRFHPLEFPIGLMVGLPLVLVMGLSPWLLLLYEILDVAVTLFSHANIELPGWMERTMRYVFVTPGLHRVHHSARPEEADSNFSAVFPLWDLVFGTFRTTTRLPALEMPLGLDEVRGPRICSIWWLLACPFRMNLSEASQADAGGDVIAVRTK